MEGFTKEIKEKEVAIVNRGSYNVVDLDKRSSVRVELRRLMLFRGKYAD